MNTLTSRKWPQWTALFLGTLAVILVPFFLFGEEIEGQISSLLQTATLHPILTALILSCLLMADILLPLPSSLLSITAGALHGWAMGFGVSLIGMSLACILGYGLGRSLGEKVALGFIGETELVRLRAAVKRYGNGMVIAFRAVPVLAEASVLFAGMSRLPWGRFLGVSILANAGVSAVYAGIGAYAWQVNSLLFAVVGALVVPVVGLWLTRK